jgi:YesN/AraC family two-component response regulator
LQTIADELHISRYYISHLFGQRLHIGFSDYINSLRVRSAAEMLKSGNKTITEIAYAVGYNSVRTFDRCFLKVRGMTPKEYREKAHSKK